MQGLYAHAKRHGGKVKVGTLGEDAVVFNFHTNGNGAAPETSTAPAVDEAAPAA